MTKPARKPESLIMEAIYSFHPMFTAEAFPVWLGGGGEDWGRAHVEGGDVEPIGNGTVMIGMGERTTPQAVLLIARALFRAGSATQVLAVHLPKSRSYMHLDTVITMCDRDLVTLFPSVVERARTWSIRPGATPDDLVTEERPGSLVEAMAEALGVSELRVIPTGGDYFEAEREQWDDGNNVVALEPGVVAYERNTGTNTALRKAGIEVIAIEGFELGLAPGARTLAGVRAGGYRRPSSTRELPLPSGTINGTGRPTMYDETARCELHEGLREALGEARGDTLMSLLPPVGWADIATNHELDLLGDRVDARVDGVLLEIEALRESTAAQIEIARLASEKAMAELEARLHRDMLRLTWSMIGGFVAIAGVLAANNVL